MITETNLCNILNISRTTVRQCMDRLVDEGLLVRYRGRGSFIADPKMKRNINCLYNFTENMRELGAVPTSVVIKSEVVEADQYIRDQLKLPPTQNKVFKLYRLRCANNEPILFEKAFVPYYLCERIEFFDFSTVSLYKVLSERYALNLYRATETIEAIIINKDEADLLKCAGKGPLAIRFSVSLIWIRDLYSNLPPLSPGPISAYSSWNCTAIHPPAKARLTSAGR